MSNKQNQFTYLKDYKPFPYEILHVEMRFEIAEKSTKLVSVLQIEKAKNSTLSEPLILDGDDILLEKILLNGSPLSSEDYKLSSNELKISSPPKELFTLEITTNLSPDDNSDLMGLYRSNGVWCTQCEPEGFRRMTYFPDRPDVLTKYQVRLEADKALVPILLANGNLVEKGDLTNNRHYAIWDDPHKKPSYLFAIVAGNLGKIEDEFITMSGKKIDLAIYCEHGKEAKCNYAMDALKRSMQWDEKRFGREYDLEVFNIVAVSDFNFGAMENKGLNIFNEKLVLADAQSATDRDYARIESVIAHEYFHNWTGNRITCRDWFQLCLKEGLTVYRDQEFTSDERSRTVKRIEDVRLLRLAQFPEDAGPLAHPARPEKYREIDNFYTATVYEKGAEIVRMLATILGEQEFRKGCDLYFERHDGQATTIEAWIKIFEDSSGQNLEHFKQWYLQAGTPKVNVKTIWDNENKVFTLKLKQQTKATAEQSKKQVMYIPIKFGLVGPNGKDMQYSAVSGAYVKDDIIIFDKEQMEVKFEGLTYRPVLSLLRDFSAPIELESNNNTKEKLFLANYDSNDFNRWQALNDVALDLLLSEIKNNNKTDNYFDIEDFVETLSETLTENSLDDALKALALDLPSEVILAQAIGENIDPLAIYNVRKQLQKNIGNQLFVQFSLLYSALSKKCTPYSLDAKAIKARALRNQIVFLIVASGDKGAIEIAKKHYFNADNMSDRMAALSAIVANDRKNAKILLADFYQKYCDNALIYDKWLALSASAPDNNCLEQVRAIYNSANFAKTNPNRLRSLVGVFAHSNKTQFARIDGAGFDFVIDVCKEIDKINSQSAAGIVSAFEAWRNFEPIRKEKAKLALERLKKEKLSNNVFDILVRILG